MHMFGLERVFTSLKWTSLDEFTRVSYKLLPVYAVLVGSCIVLIVLLRLLEPEGPEKYRRVLREQRQEASDPTVTLKRTAGAAAAVDVKKTD
jgi:hypothetical protein